jgi:starch phosphorylase
MKAALNGVPSFSVLDGWWLEGHIEGVTGWAIGRDMDRPQVTEPHAGGVEHAVALYDTLERAVLPTFYQRREAFIDMMRNAIALNGGFFTAQRMLHEYLAKAYDVQSVVDQPQPTRRPAPAAELSA